MSEGSSTQSRVYDADGNLLLQSDPPAGTTVFIGDTELHVAPGATAASGSRTYTAGSMPLGERDTTAGVSGSKLYWLGSDVDGTPDLEVNAATGQVTYRYTDPFGNTRGTAPSWSSDRQFLNDPSSTLTGLTQVGARLYDPATGSFTTADPLLDATSFASRNGYAYAGNDPVTTADPSGECQEPGDVLTHITNCAGGQGVTAASSELLNQQKHPAKPAAPAPGSSAASAGASPGGSEGASKSASSGKSNTIRIDPTKAQYNAVAGFGNKGLYVGEGATAQGLQYTGMFVGGALVVACVAFSGGACAAILLADGSIVGTNGLDASGLSEPSDSWLSDAQLGAKIGKHAKDFGLDPSNPLARATLQEYINEARYDPDEVRQGDWRGGKTDYWFYRRGSNVVVTNNNGAFVTILKGGIKNGWFQNAATR